MDKLRVSEIIDRFSGKKIVVVGDVMLDEYVWGQVNRISPEAPVMVVDADRNTHVPGGAANVLNNLCALGASGVMVGAVGDDEAGQALASCLKSEGGDISGLIVAKGRPTTRKQRIIAHSQQVVRVDFEKRGNFEGNELELLLAKIHQLGSEADAIVISDYHKGVVTPEVIRVCVQIAKDRKIPLTGNLKPRTITPEAAMTILQVNLLEAGQAVGAGEPLGTQEKVERAGFELLQRTGSEHILITRGSNGLTLVSAQGRDVVNVPPRPVEVYDAAGAGDTVISVLTLALSSGATAAEAVTIANYAAAETVKKVGVTTVSCAEIVASFA